MSAIGIKIDDSRLKAALKGTKTSFRTSVLASIVKTSVKPMADTARALAPDRRETGKPNKKPQKRFRKEYPAGGLKRSIGIKVFTNQSNMSVYVGTHKTKLYDAWYAMFVEKGTKDRFYKGKSRGRINPMAFIERAKNLKEAECVNNIEIRTSKKIEEIWNKYRFK